MGKSPNPAAVFASRWNFAAAFAAWLLPGLGHFLLGQPRRGVILGVSIGTLWALGLLVGGISIIDREDHPAWFLGQMLLAPSLAADWYHHELLPAGAPPPHPDREPPLAPAFGRAHEQGTLFTSLAGLLNLLAILDVIYRDPRTDAPAWASNPADPDETKEDQPSHQPDLRSQPHGRQS